MKIIDAHFHLFPAGPHTEEMTRAVGHESTPEHLLHVFRQLGVVGGVVMGNGGLELGVQDFPESLGYCVGLDSRCKAELDPNRALDQVEAHLRRKTCVGIKLYPGYNAEYVSDPFYEPYYELARHYGKAVAIHMGMTAMPQAKLKYCHPLTLDEVAADHPRNQFVMCHFGNPFLADAAAVLEKNRNVAADLSGLLAGITDLDRYFEVQSGYVSMLRSWIAYVENAEQFLYGSDFPAVNVENYIRFAQRLLPEEIWDKVFFENANRIYALGL